MLLNTEAKREAVAAATTAEELWKAMGGVDCWAVVPIASVHRAGHDLEGTRLTVSRESSGNSAENRCTVAMTAGQMCPSPLCSAPAMTWQPPASRSVLQ